MRIEKVATVTTTTTASERRKRLKLKRIVISEHNYLALKKLGYAGDSFNDVVSRLLQVYRAYQENKKQQEEQERQQHALHNIVFSNQGNCIQFANSFKSSDNDRDGDVDHDHRQLVKDVIRDECKHD